MFYSIELHTDGTVRLGFDSSNGNPTFILITPTDLGEFEALNNLDEERNPEAFMEDLLHWGYKQLRDIAR
jgi:hypothetical protein